MMSCTRQASFDAASFREAFRKNSSSTSAAVLQEDHSARNPSFLDALNVIDSPGNAGSNCDSLEASQAVENKSKSIADEEMVCRGEEDTAEIPMPSYSSKGKMKGDDFVLPPASDGRLRGREAGNSEPESVPLFRKDRVAMAVPSIVSHLAGGTPDSEGRQSRSVTLKSARSEEGGELRWKTRSRAIHCRLHARDYSDCMAFHFIHPLQVSSPQVAMRDAVEEALAADASTCEDFISNMKEMIQLESTYGRLRAHQRRACTAADSIILQAQGQEEGKERQKRPAEERSKEREMEVLEENEAGDISGRQKSPAKRKCNAIRLGLVPDKNLSVTYANKVFSPANLRSLIVHGTNSRVGGCEMTRESMKFPLNTGERVNPPGDAKLRTLGECWESRKLLVVIEESQAADTSEDLGVPLIVGGTGYQRKYPRRFAGKDENQRTKMRGNPLEVLGSDVMLVVFSLLDARSLATCGLISKDWKVLAHKDSLWLSQCAKLWEGKTHLPCSALQDGLPKMVAYSRSVQDAKRVAPAYWLDLDPAQRGEAPMKRFFQMDGSQTAEPDDEVWGGHESFYSLISELNPEESKLDHFVQINHWPYMSVSRTTEWGWVLNSRVHDYQSMPDSWKRGGTGPTSPPS